MGNVGLMPPGCWLLKSFQFDSPEVTFRLLRPVRLLQHRTTYVSVSVSASVSVSFSLSPSLYLFLSLPELSGSPQCFLFLSRILSPEVLAALVTHCFNSFSVRRSCFYSSFCGRVSLMQADISHSLMFKEESHVVRNMHSAEGTLLLSRACVEGFPGCSVSSGPHCLIRHLTSSRFGEF